MALTLGRYELVRPLAQGGMAEVFLARRRTAGGVDKRLVIKRIRRERLRDPRFINLFVQEARMSMSLAHKNIVPVFDFGRAGDELFLAMEYVDGPDLGRVLDTARRTDERLDPMLVAYIGLEACQALDYAHNAHGDDSRALVHRDVTPRNVLISRAGEIKLVDFGVATSEIDGISEAIRGTPAYMSPEQARGEAVDARSDVFSLGLILWQALAGRRAYQGEDHHALLAQARLGQVPALPDDVPAPLCRIVARATARNRDLRFASSRDMQLALDEYLVGARAVAGGAPPSHALAAWLENHPMDEARADGWHTEAPAGRVVTFLDDGEGDVLRGPDANSGTLGSIAETMAETAADMDDEAAGNAGAGSAAESGQESGLESRPDAHATTLPAPDGDHAQASVAARDSTPASQSTPAARRRRGLVPWLAAAVAVVIAAGIGASVLRGQDSAAPGPAAQDLEPLATPVAAASSETGEPAAMHETPGTAAVTAPRDTTAVAMPAPAPIDQSAAPPRRDEPARTAARNEPARTRPARGDRKKNSGKTSNPDGVPAASAATGTVKISATPWARVTVAGSSAQCAETPCTLSLPAGAHVLVLENPVAGLRKERAIQVTSGQTLVVRETLTR